jgi:hypothetical protein
MSNDVYPNAVRGLTFTVVRAPEFSTVVHSAPNFQQTRIRQAANPRWHWELKYDYLKNIPTDLAPTLTQTDLATLFGFFLGHCGEWDDFVFNDAQTPDNSVGPALIAGNPNPNAQLQLLQDSETSVWYSPIQRNFGGWFLEDIADLNGAIAVYDNKVLKTLNTHYQVLGPGLAIPGYSFAGKYLEWLYTPTGPINVAFNFYFRVHYEMDRLDFEKFMDRLWTGGGQRGGSSIKIETSRIYIPS